MSYVLMLSYVPVFVLVLARIGGLVLFAPLFGSARIPKRVRALLVIILAMGFTTSVARPVALPSSTWALALGMGAELMFGLAMGMVLSFVFIAAQWAGEMVGTQMGFNAGAVVDPEYGGSSSVIGDLYYLLTLVVFLTLGGHRQMVQGIHDSFTVLPLLSVGIDRSVLDLIVRMLEGATTLAVRLAAPVMVTLMITDLVLGFLGKTLPQLNVMTAGMSVKSMVGLLVMIIGIGLYIMPNVLSDAINQSLQTVTTVWGTPTGANK